MTWEELKKSIYFEDGSFRDIYVFNTTIKDWEKWIDYVNANHKVIFKINSQIVDKIIDKAKVLNYLKDKYAVDYTPSASVILGEVILNCLFFFEDEIDNDILPSEMKSIKNHEELSNYLIEVSKLLSKKIVLTKEAERDQTLLSVEKDLVQTHQ